MAFSGSQITRLGLAAVARSLYGSFSGKEESVSYIYLSDPSDAYSFTSHSADGYSFSVRAADSYEFPSHTSDGYVLPEPV